MNKEFISAITALSLSAVGTIITASADNSLSNTELTADKTAQWTQQEASTGYDLRIHGWENWENAAYIGFTLPEDFAPDSLQNAVLKLDTTSAKNAGPAYIYAADYSSFENAQQYEGSSTPSYTEKELLSFTSPVSVGEFDIDLTDYISSLPSTTTTVAFRIDTKSENSNTGWTIGSANNGTAPKLCLDYGTGEPQKGTILNNRFSSGLDNWNVEGSIRAEDGAAILTGSNARISQIVEGIEDGIYDVGAAVMTSDITGTAYLYAKAEGQAAAKTAIPQASEAMTITVPGVEVKNGILEVGAFADEKSENTVTIDNLTLTKSADTRAPFLKGGEISKLTYVEDMGAVFKREDGTEGDALQIMAENGFNLARIRLLDDPGKGHGDGDYYLPEGYMTLEDCLHLARRAKSKGMQIEYTIAYSDYWVDGEKQMVPYSWQQEITENGLTGENLVAYLEKKIYEYTKISMQAMIDQDTCPEYVSIGNEIQVGILFNKYKSNNGLYNNSTYLARLLNAGAKAVRETAPHTKIILHSDNGGLVQKRSTFMKVLDNVDYDVIGVSFYPYYNSTVSIDAVVSEFNTFVNKYDKDVIIMETGYNWSPLKADGWPGQLENSGYYQDIYGETQDGQRAFLTELYAKLKTVLDGRCIGDLYWDPIMVHSPEWKIGWAISEADDTTQSNVVPNSTIFDFDGKAVEGQKAMKYNSNSTDKLLITGKLLDKDGKIRTNTKTFVTIGGKDYNVMSDAYGDYIAAVPYPKENVLNISVRNDENIRKVDVPKYDTLITHVDLTVEKENPPYIFDINDKQFTAQCADTNINMYAAEFDENDRFIAVHRDKKSGTISGNAATVKVFAWNKNDHSPIPEFAPSHFEMKSATIQR